jgi:short-subunit dehydrogenase
MTDVATRVVITGASDGIGRALAEQYARRGARIALAARRREVLEEVRVACEAAGGMATAVAADVSQPTSCKALIEASVAELGGIDVLINNAGVSMQDRFEDIQSFEVFERMLAINYLGAVYCSHYALPHLRRTRGTLVAISSLQGKLGFPGSTAYSASKHALQGFMDSLRTELAGSGVHVLVVSPGPVATKIHSNFLKADGTPARGAHGGATAGMAVDLCASKVVRAIDRRRRELVMTAGGKLAVMLRPFVPAFVDRQLARAVRDFYARLDETRRRRR